MTAAPSNKILICVGTSGVAAGAEKVASAFEHELSQRGLGKEYEIVRTGDRGLFRDVLVDIITPQHGRVGYEYIKPENVTRIVEEHVVKGEPVADLRAGKDYEDFF
jgi:NADH-quinone oxidoreductase subunit F